MASAAVTSETGVVLENNPTQLEADGRNKWHTNADKLFTGDLSQNERQGKFANPKRIGLAQAGDISKGDVIPVFKMDGVGSSDANGKPDDTDLLDSLRIQPTTLTVSENTGVTFADNGLPRLQHERQDGDEIYLPIPEILAAVASTGEQLTARQQSDLLTAMTAAYQQADYLGRQRGLRPLTEAAVNQDLPELWLNNPDLLQNTSEHLHKTYADFITSYMGKVAPVILRQREDGSPELFNLVTTTYDKLSDKWKKVNETSARHILAIVQMVQNYYPELLNTEPDPLTGLPKFNEDAIFRINAALFEVWANGEDLKTNDSGENILTSKRNPLFALRSYDNLQEISQGGEPKEGWDRFLGRYRVFLHANASTYSEIISHLEIDLDTDQSGELDTSEIFLASKETLKKVAQAQADFELVKDAYMMRGVLRNLVQQQALGAAAN
jgi:hypothetical protein